MQTLYRVPISAALIATAASLLPATAQAFPYGVAAMTDWTGCDCYESPLSYTDDQVVYMSSHLNSMGNTRLWYYKNANVWSGDIIEDSLGGRDNERVDDAYLYAYSGHGSAPGAVQRYTAKWCEPFMYESCQIDSRDIKLGEKAGPYVSSDWANLAYLILSTCHSVDTRPNEQWGDLLRYGVDMIVGFRGTSTDGETTDEVLADYVDAVFDESATLKSSWFYAVDDWSVDDTGAVVGSGVSEADAIYWRDNVFKNMHRTGVARNWTAWAWHQG